MIVVETYKHVVYVYDHAFITAQFLTLFHALVSGITSCGSNQLVGFADEVYSSISATTSVIFYSYIRAMVPSAKDTLDKGPTG